MATIDLTLTTDLTTMKRAMNAREMALFWEGAGSRPCRTATGRDIGCPNMRDGDRCKFTKSRCILVTPTFEDRLAEYKAAKAAKDKKPARVFDPADAPDDLGAGDDLSLEELAEEEVKPKRRSWASYHPNRR